MNNKLPPRIPVRQAALLLNLPQSTLYQQIQAGRDGLGGNHAGRRTVQLKAVLDRCGLTRQEAEQWLSEMEDAA